MPTKSENGTYIFSASEIGTYVVCPQAWYLEKVQGLRTEISPKALEGTKKRKKWEKELSEAKEFTWVTRALIFLIVFLIVIYFFVRIM